MIPRLLASFARRRLRLAPAVAILGPRQCGKSTLAKSLLEARDSIHLDLELPSDRAKLEDPEAFFGEHAKRLVCLDEIHRIPELFPVLRAILDRTGRAGQLLILGSASPGLLRQSSESLAGRLAYVELTPFLLPEVQTDAGIDDRLLRRLWVRGGFPRSYLSRSDAASLAWREDFIRTFLERDIPQFGIRIPAESIRRLWLMCAHAHGQLLNSSQLGGSLGLSHTTVRSHLELLSQALMIRLLPPLEANLGKRLVKSPKLFVRDSGILLALLGVPSFDALLGHPAYGPAWEGLVIENVLAVLGSGWRASFYRTAAGAELDLVVERGGRRIGIECKASTAPQATKGFWSALADLRLRRAYIVSPVREGHPLGRGAAVIPLRHLLAELGSLAT